MKLRINTSGTNTSNKQDAVIANSYRDKFIIPLNFEMLDSMIPYYQSGPAKPDAQYKIVDVSLEYEIITQPDLQGRIQTGSKGSHKPVKHFRFFKTKY